ncbi:MAG: type IV toxin-antitoxin system AbiEi family antitoxin domain-containing protein [Oligoflexus sp.]
MHPSVLSYYVKKGILERIDRGVYRARDTDIDIDFMWEDLILAVKSVSSGVVCLISALVLYEMTDEIPRVHWIAIPHSSRAPKREGIKIVRMRNLELGRTTLDIGNQSISIFDRERTIIDAFRYLGQETAIKALKTGLQAKGKNKIQLKKLQLYAKELRLNIGPYLLAVTT